MKGGGSWIGGLGRSGRERFPTCYVRRGDSPRDRGLWRVAEPTVEPTAEPLLIPKPITEDYLNRKRNDGHLVEEYFRWYKEKHTGGRKFLQGSWIKLKIDGAQESEEKMWLVPPVFRRDLAVEPLPDELEKKMLQRDRDAAAQHHAKPPSCAEKLLYALRGFGFYYETEVDSMCAPKGYETFQDVCETRVADCEDWTFLTNRVYLSLNPKPGSRNFVFAHTTLYWNGTALNRDDGGAQGPAGAHSLGMLFPKKKFDARAPNPCSASECWIVDAPFNIACRLSEYLDLLGENGGSFPNKTKHTHGGAVRLVRPELIMCTVFYGPDLGSESFRLTTAKTASGEWTINLNFGNETPALKPLVWHRGLMVNRWVGQPPTIGADCLGTAGLIV